jgi:hypothetical protein
MNRLITTKHWIDQLGGVVVYCTEGPKRSEPASRGKSGKDAVFLRTVIKQLLLPSTIGRDTFESKFLQSVNVRGRRINRQQCSMIATDVTKVPCDGEIF